jgi:8-oxo-dGTP pyrophosphatase MutT (NUDIX family)
MIGGGCKKTETGLDAIVREVYEELGLRIPRDRFRKLAVYDNPGRIAAYRDGSIWRMVIVVYGLTLEEEPVLRISAESRELRFFTPEEVEQIQIAVTHQDIVAEQFLL